MRRGLRDPKDANGATLQRLFDLGLIDEPNRHASRTPRGQAALAAPRVTALELESLCAVERSGIRWGGKDGRLDVDGWITRDYVGAPRKLTDAGNTDLNNNRAASGSPEWKP
jgi:hypothetical protein